MFYSCSLQPTARSAITGLAIHNDNVINARAIPNCFFIYEACLTGLPDGASSVSHRHLIHSTPKSKSHVLSKYAASQSDSEMWNDCGSSVEQQRSGSKAWSTSAECVGCSSCHPHYSSQPNLPAAVAYTE